ncbi:MAG: hypothetical protein JWN32_1599 [Solirubrobacterales bacterium]|nr:hypothetical protein [Solirubrobacterales bacterium]
MHDWRPRRRRVSTTRRRALPVAAVALAAAIPFASADARAASVNVVGDSVIVTGQPFGNATIQVTRPDALTGKPVVIGFFSGRADSIGPFTVNTTTQTALSPNGDCWQAGALSQALTPDIRPGDTVTFSAQPVLGGSSDSASVTVPANAPDDPSGPIPSCRSSAPFAENAVTAGPKSVSGGPIAVSGVAQPLATGVSSFISDGARSTSPVDAAPNPDGTWGATIPAAQVDPLANGSLTVSPIFAVPDVGTGALAHVAGDPISVEKTRAGHATAPGSQPGSQGSGKATGAPRVSKMRVQSRISIAAARRGGLRASFVVPGGARVIGAQLLRGKRTVFRSTVPAGKAGTTQTVRLRGAALRRVLRRGRYTLALSAGPSRNRLGTPVRRTIRVG